MVVAAYWYLETMIWPMRMMSIATKHVKNALGNGFVSSHSRETKPKKDPTLVEERASGRAAAVKSAG